MNAGLPIALLLIVLGVGAYVEGTISDRWGKPSSEQLSDFSKRLLTVPKQIGDWEGVDHELNEVDFKKSST